MKKTLCWMMIASAMTFASCNYDELNDALEHAIERSWYGNWCGPNWTGGFPKSYDKLSVAESKAALPPVTKLDSCCQTHDIVYAVCRKANPCDAAARQKCFEQADRDLSSCASRSGSGYGANLLLFGNPQKRIQDYMRDSSPAAEDNAKDCSCTK